ncbi:MAG TPA: helix-turn-helix domain-containing protein [Candidatus Binataceae bacterium]|nr:helix-turn-helix domain-containing protein [Candidatus Binataceae bacterium]
MTSERSPAQPAASNGVGRVGRRKARTRQMLIDAARALLAERGIESLSVDEITERADVAKGTFYNYFDDKDDLARAAAAAVRAELETEIGHVNARIADPAVRIARAFVSVLWFGILKPEHASAMMQLFPNAADPSAPLNKGVSADIRAGLAAGRIDVPSVEAGVAYVVGVAVVGLNRAIGFSHERGGVFARSLGAILLRGLGLSRNEASRIMNSAVASIMESNSAEVSRWE